MDLKYYFKKQYQFQLCTIPKFYKREIDLEEKEIRKFNEFELCTDSDKKIDTYEVISIKNIHLFSSEIWKQINKKTGSLLSVYLYIPSRMNDLNEGVYLCANGELIRVTSSNWVKRFAIRELNSPCFIVACNLDKLTIVGNNGFVKAVKQAGVFEDTVCNLLNIDELEKQKYESNINRNQLSVSAGLNLNNILILGIVNIGVN